MFQKNETFWPKLECSWHGYFETFAYMDKLIEDFLAFLSHFFKIIVAETCSLWLMTKMFVLSKQELSSNSFHDFFQLSQTKPLQCWLYNYQNILLNYTKLFQALQNCNLTIIILKRTTLSLCIILCCNFHNFLQLWSILF